MTVLVALIMQQVLLYMKARLPIFMCAQTELMNCSFIVNHQAKNKLKVNLEGFSKLVLENKVMNGGT